MLFKCLIFEGKSMNSRDIGRDISGEEFSATEETYKFRDSIYGDTTG